MCFLIPKSDKQVQKKLYTQYASKTPASKIFSSLSVMKTNQKNIQLFSKMAYLISTPQFLGGHFPGQWL